MHDYIVTLRDTSSCPNRHCFIPEPHQDTPTYLQVPSNKKIPKPLHAVDVASWIDAIASQTKACPNKPSELIFFVHGYNNAPEVNLVRHRLFKQHLESFDFNGTIISFDWPSDSSFSNYDEDVADGLCVIEHLWKSALNLFENDTRFNLHLLAHSVGCYLSIESINTKSAKSHLLNKIFFIGADAHQNALQKSSFNHYGQNIINYYMPYDMSLFFSYLMQYYLLHKRAGQSKLLGKNIQNINTSNAFKKLPWPKNPFKYLSHTHSWYFESKFLVGDIVNVIENRDFIDRKVVNGEVCI